METDYQALVVEKDENKSFSYGLKTLQVGSLPKKDVLIRVHYSTINFKDSLSCQGHPAITRRFPHTPGIDAAGIVESSESDDFKVGDRVAIVSQPMGMNSPGGFGQYVNVPASWVIKIEKSLSLEEAMIYGTAGYTAALAVQALIDSRIDLENSKVVVTGATGGVGCVSVALLSKLGCQVTAVTGKSDAEEFLKNIGAAEVLSRSDFETNAGQNLLVPKWEAAIDVAGGETLATTLKLIRDRGAVIATGMVNDTSFQTTVLPFILRGISLIGVNAENTPIEKRDDVWRKMATIWKPDTLTSLYKLITLQELESAMDLAIKGQQVGRIVVDMR